MNYNKTIDDEQNEQTEYVYINADEDCLDLEDMFEGIFIKSQNSWRIKKMYHESVLEYLNVPEDTNDTKPEVKKSRRYHRSNSFNNLNDTDEEFSSSDENYTRARSTKAIKNFQDEEIVKIKNKILTKKANAKKTVSNLDKIIVNEITATPSE